MANWRPIGTSEISIWYRGEQAVQWRSEAHTHHSRGTHHRGTHTTEADTIQVAILGYKSGEEYRAMEQSVRQQQLGGDDALNLASLPPPCASSTPP